MFYRYTGNPLDTSNWDLTFGPPPTQVTAVVQVASPFPQDPLFVGGSVGSPAGGGDLPGVIWAFISDGVRTFTPDTVFLHGYGVTIREWIIEGGFLIQAGSSGGRAITSWRITSNAPQSGGGDLAVFQRHAVEGPTGAVMETSVKTDISGGWTAVLNTDMESGNTGVVSD